MFFQKNIDTWLHMATHGYTWLINYTAEKILMLSSYMAWGLATLWMEGCPMSGTSYKKALQIDCSNIRHHKTFYCRQVSCMIILIDGDGYEPKWCALFGARNAICFVFKIHSEWYRYLKEPHLKQCSIAKMECHAMICGSNASWLAALSNKAPMV